MKTKLALILISAALFASCGSGSRTNFDASAYSDLRSASGGGFICFYDGDRYIASFAFKNTEDLGAYADQKSLVAAPKKSAYRFIDLKDGLLFIREAGAASAPTPVRIVDLATRKDLIEKGFKSLADHAKEIERYAIMKFAGDRLTAEQLPKLTMPVEKMEAFATSAFKRGLAVEYYEIFRFDFQSRQAISENEIRPVMYPRNILY